MNSKRVLGVLVLIGGVTAILAGAYIEQQVAEGKNKISSAQKKVDTGNDLFSMNPIAKEVGGQLTGSAQKKIDEGKGQVAKYEQISDWMRIGGIVLIVVGAAVIVFSGKKRKS